MTVVDETNAGTTRDQRLEKLIAEYLEAVASGQSPERRNLLDRHPDLAADLSAFFVDHDRMQQIAAPLAETLTTPKLPGWEAAHLATTSTGPRQAAAIQAVEETAGQPDRGGALRDFGDYELLDEIARGGMGVVYKARQKSLNRTVALKLILTGQLASEDEIQRFRTEAEAAANLDHPAIVPIYEVGVRDGQHYFSMGYVDGQSLAARVSGGPLLPCEAAAHVRTVAEAVPYAHQAGVIHRDLKPANILAMFRLIRDMQPKDKVLNIAFAVCAAFLFGDHLAFTANFQPNLIPAVMLGKLGGGMAAFLLAFRLSVPKALALEKQQFGTLVPPASVPVDHPSGIILGGKSSAKADP